jgi:hypothetical protein
MLSNYLEGLVHYNSRSEQRLGVREFLRGIDYYTWNQLDGRENDNGRKGRLELRIKTKKNKNKKERKGRFPLSQRNVNAPRGMADMARSFNWYVAHFFLPRVVTSKDHKAASMGTLLVQFPFLSLALTYVASFFS